MTAPHVAYAVSYASAGCLPDNEPRGPYVVTTRAQLASLIKDELNAYELPSSRFASVGIRRLWRLICNAGSASSMGFSIEGEGLYTLTFHGLTRAEAEEMEAAQGD